MGGELGCVAALVAGLQVVQVGNGRARTVGGICLTAGVVGGGVWATQVQSSPAPRAQAMSIADPTILGAVVSWAVYAFAVFARRSAGWSGRRAAYLSAIGFLIVLLNFVPVGFFLTKSHNF